MYNKFYNLKQTPFEISSDPSFLWLGEKHREALATLRYGILKNKGFLLLTGDVGTGKTTLINALTMNLPKNVIYAYISDPSLSLLEFYNYILHAFNMESECSNKNEFLILFKNFLIKSYETKKKILLIIDESQLLSDDLLEQIRLLSNIEKPEKKVLNIFFVGQPEFNNVLMKEKNRALRQRITLNYNIEPFLHSETQKYITYRLYKAGSKKDLFDKKAIKIIHKQSGGFPRRINVICDHCLLSGYSANKKTINKKIVKECVKELKLPTENFIIKKLAIVISVIFLLISISAGIIVFYKSNSTLLTDKKTSEEINLSNSEITAQKTLDFKEINRRITEEKNILSENIIESDIIDTPEIDSIAETSEIKERYNPDKQKNISKNQSLPENQNLSDEQDIEEKENLPAKQNISKEKTPSLPFKEQIIVLKFKYNTNQFEESELVKIHNAAEIMKKYPDTEALITGYTDSVGQRDYNLKLSIFRANLAQGVLLGAGISEKRMQVKGLGDKNPVESNDTPWGRKANRRVEIKIYQKDQ